MSFISTKASKASLLVALIVLATACADSAAGPAASEEASASDADAASISGQDSAISGQDSASAAEVADSGLDAMSQDAGPASDPSDAMAASDLLSAAEEASLLYMREEEKLARDTYLLNSAALPVFEHISASEQQHMDILLTLITRFRLTDPVGSHDRGVFVNPGLQTLYEQLALRARSSLDEALKVGAEIEEIDIADLREASRQVSHPDLAAAYQLLMRGSENHLRAFQRNLVMRGISYTPQRLDADEFAEIINGGMARGPAP